jgi:2-polyprenyl-3-methyl-5-hydroxy-6-metoxy-1,4-benzoquinol methylase
MVERGIVPTFHVEVDPRPHKVHLIGPPQQGTEYLIASTCHPAVFDHLQGYDVKLWHVFDAAEDALRTLPHGEWALSGGCSVGLRTMTLARFLGFTDLHIFGMDGCEGDTGKHAAAHPMQPKGYSIVEYGGKEYRTTPSLLEVAKGTFHELDQMPDVRPTFYGDGLVQAMAKDYTPKPARKKVPIGLNKPELISAEYRSLNAELHRTNLAYGVGGEKHADTVLKISEAMKSKNILDYGCGKGRLGRAMPFQIAEYDPAVPGKDEAPKPADLVVCTDVLEHIEPEKIFYVLDDIRRCVRQVGFFVIHTGPSTKTLPDGRNAHVLQRNPKWWKRELGKFFQVAKVWEVGPLLYVIVAPGAKKKKADQLIKATA